MHLIEAKNIFMTFTNGEQNLTVLNNVSLEVDKRDFLGIYGPSGAGKSTLLHILGLLETQTSGSLLLEGKDISKIDEKNKSRIRNNKLGFIFQMYHLLPEFDLLENVILPSYVSAGNFRDRLSNADRLISRLGLRHRIHHDAKKLSGGEMQRACIARALVNSPAVLFCDEPTGNLDSKNATEVWEILKEINLNEHVTIVAVTHDQRALSYFSKVIKMENGYIISD